jgi:hypothetical protein
VRIVAIVLLVALTACQRQATVGSPQPPAPVPGAPGASSPAEAVQKFMTAVKAQDLDALSLIWGTSSGPVRSTMKREEWEMREVTIMGCLKHDSYTMRGDAPAAGGERVLQVALRFQDLTPTTGFTTTRDNDGRWYVKAVEMDPVRQVCSRRGQGR